MSVIMTTLITDGINDVDVMAVVGISGVFNSKKRKNN